MPRSLNISQLTALHLALVIAVTITGLGFVGLQTAQAAGPGASAESQLIDYCKDKAPKEVDKACNSENMNGVVNAASYECRGKKTAGETVKCQVNVGEGYIRKALNDTKKPKNAQRFKDALAIVLANTGNNTDRPAGSDVPSGNCNNGICRDPASDPDANCAGGSCDLIKKYVNPTINLLSLCFGVIAAASLIAGGIQYSASVGDSQKVTNAKKRIFNTLVAVFAYLFMYSFLQFLVPGGIFNR